MPSSASPSAASIRSSRIRCRLGIRSTGISHPSSTRCADSCRGDLLGDLPSHRRICGDRALALPAHRLSGGLLHLAPHAAYEIPAAGAADPALLGQLSHAHAGLGQSFRARGLRQRLPALVASGDHAAGLAERQSRLGHPRAGLRLYPLSHPALAGLPRPHRQEPAGGGPRSRRQPLQRLPAGDPAAVEDGHIGGQRHHRSADVRRLLHAQHRLRLAQDQHAGQSDRHLFPRRDRSPPWERHSP